MTVGRIPEGWIGVEQSHELAKLCAFGQDDQGNSCQESNDSCQGKLVAN